MQDPGRVQLWYRACLVLLQLQSLHVMEVSVLYAMQAELEAAAVSGATVSVQLPDSGRQVQVAVGQDWHEEWQAMHQGKILVRYYIKWVQDDSGALTVLEVAAPRPVQQEAVAGSSNGSHSTAGSASLLQRSSNNSLNKDFLAPVAA